MEEVKTPDTLRDKDILQRLRENDPFASSASPLPWNNANPDLGSLNREATEAIEQLLREKRRAPSMPLAGLILGEAGAGKTHMLMRILRRMRENGQIAIFVTVRTFRDPDSVMGHLLTEIIISLSREHSAGRSQLDMLMGELDSVYRDSCQEEGFSIHQGVERLSFLRTRMPGVDKGLLKCFLLYVEETSPDVRMELLDWIRSGLDEEDCERLGLPQRDLDSMNEAKREADAEKMLLSIGQILAYAKVPMTVCFDQLDGMESRELIIAWGRMLSLLVNDLRGVLPLAFLRADTWNTRFSTQLDDSVVQRMTGRPPIVIGNCSLEQARQLIRDRVRALFGGDADGISAWLLSRLEGKLHAGYSPRSVINLANQAIVEADVPPFLDSVSAENKAMEAAYQEECDKVRMAPSDWPPDGGNLLLALGIWLGSQEDFNVGTSEDPYVRLRGTWGKTECAFIVLTSKNHSSVRAALKRGIIFLTQHPKGLCLYVTERQTAHWPASWKVVHQHMSEFAELGGRFLVLDDEERVQWYGLVALFNKLENGDVTLLSSSGQRSASRDDLRRYMKEAFPSDFLKLGNSQSQQKLPGRGDDAEPAASPRPSPNKRTPSPTPNDEPLAQILLSLLDTSPMKLLPAGKMVEMLSSRNLDVSITRLLACVSRFQGQFHVYPAGKDTLIQRAGR